MTCLEINSTNYYQTWYRKLRGKLTLKYLAIGFLACLLSTLTFQVTANEKNYLEEQIHAVFLYNLTRFVRWPDSAFKSKNAPHRICVIGKTPIVDLLRKVVTGEMVRGRQFSVINKKTVQSSTNCHILFFTSISVRLHSKQIQLLRNHPVLLISPLSNFVHGPGMLALGEKGNRVQPIINIKNVNSANIKISSKLLHLATIVGRE